MMPRLLCLTLLPIICYLDPESSITFAKGHPPLQQDATNQESDSIEHKLTSGDIIYFKDYRSWRYGIVRSIEDGRIKANYLEKNRSRSSTSFSLSSTKWEMVLENGADPDLPTAAKVVRNWTSADGKFEIVAKLINKDDKTIRLVRLDGNRIKVPLKSLSEKDREFLSQDFSAAENVNPFETSKEREIRQGLHPEAKRLLQYKIFLDESGENHVKFLQDLEKAKLITLKPSKWEYRPAPNKSTINLSSPIRRTVFNTPQSGEVTGFHISQPSQTAAFAIGSMIYGTPVVAVCDLKKRNLVTHKIPYGRKETVLEISPSGETFVSGNLDSYDSHIWTFWRVKNGKIERLFTTSGIKIREDTKSIVLLDDNRVIVNHEKIGLVLAEIQDGYLRPISIFEDGSIQKTAYLEVQRHQNTLFFGRKNSRQLWVMDLTTQRIVGTVELPKFKARSNFVLSEDGKDLVFHSENKVHFISLTDGKTMKSFDLAVQRRLNNYQPVSWTDGKLALLRSSSIVDLERKIKIGTYFPGTAFPRISSSSSMWNGKKILVSFDTKKVVTSGKTIYQTSLDIYQNTIPIKDFVDHNNSITDQDIIHLKKGSKIKIRLEIGDDHPQSESLKLKLSKKLQDLGFVVDDNGEFELIATYKEEAKRKVYNPTSRDPDKRFFYVKPQNFTITIKKGDHQIFQGTTLHPDGRYRSYTDSAKIEDAKTARPIEHFLTIVIPKEVRIIPKDKLKLFGR